jgi:hypothetical protein
VWWWKPIIPTVEGAGAEAGESKFEASLGYIAKHCLIRKKKKEKKRKERKENKKTSVKLGNSSVAMLVLSFNKCTMVLVLETKGNFLNNQYLRNT